MQFWIHLGLTILIDLMDSSNDLVNWLTNPLSVGRDQNYLFFDSTCKSDLKIWEFIQLPFKDFQDRTNPGSARDGSKDDSAHLPSVCWPRPRPPIFDSTCKTNLKIWEFIQLPFKDFQDRTNPGSARDGSKDDSAHLLYRRKSKFHYRVGKAKPIQMLTEKNDVLTSRFDPGFLNGVQTQKNWKIRFGG